MLLRNVLGKTLRDHWHAVVWWALGLSLMSAFELAIYPSVRDQAGRMSELVASYPKAVKAFFGLAEDFTTGSGFLQAELFSLMVPLVMLALGITLGSGVTAAEEDRGTLELLLSLPVSRRRVVLEKAAAVAVALTVVAVTLALTLTVGTVLLDMRVSGLRILVACLGAGLLGAAYAGVSLAVACLSGRRGLAAGVGVGLALAAYLLHGLAPLVAGLRPWRVLSPFSWYAGSGPLTEGLQSDHALALVALALLSTAVAVVAFDHHDLRG